MDELVKTLDKYFEYWILGVLMWSIVAVSVRAARGGQWSELWALPEIRKSDSRFRQVFLAATLLGALYLTGLAINLVGIWLLQPAHAHVIHTTHERLDAKAGLQARDLVFFLRPLPFSRRIVPAEHATQQADAALQFRWQVNHKDSFEAQLGGALKQLRMLRGLVVLALALFAGSACVLAARALGHAKRLPAWFGGAGLATACLLYGLTMTIYWEYEVDLHRDVWLSQTIVKEAGP